MKSRLPTLMTPFLFSLVLAGNPVLAQEAEQEADTPDSVLNDATEAGSASTDPGVGTDRVPPNTLHPTGLDEEYRLLDENQDGLLDQDELNAYESPAAGGNRAEAEPEERELKFYDYDEDEDGYLNEEEFQRWSWPPDDARGRGAAVEDGAPGLTDEE